MPAVRKAARRSDAWARTGAAAPTAAPRPAPPAPTRRRCGCGSSACGCRGGASAVSGSQPGRRRLAVARAASAEPEPAGPAEVPPTGGSGPGGALELVNDLGVLAMRVGAAALTPHHGLDKLGNAAGFSEFVVAKHLAFLPFPLFWTYCAIAAQILAPVGLALGVKNFNLSRLCSASLFGCMFMAVWFHIDEKVRKLPVGGQRLCSGTDNREGVGGLPARRRRGPQLRVRAGCDVRARVCLLHAGGPGQARAGQRRPGGQEVTPWWNVGSPPGRAPSPCPAGNGSGNPPPRAVTKRNDT